MERFKLDERLLKKRILLLTGEITKEKINVLRNLLFFLNNISKKEIKLIIDTRGGDVNSVLKFYDAIRLSNAPVTCIVDGECSSSGVAILQAGKKRLITKHSFIFMHPISIHFEKEDFVIDEKTEKRFIERLKATKKRQEFIYEIVSKRSGLTIEETKKKEGKFIFAEEAKALNLIDKIVEEYKIF